MNHQGILDFFAEEKAMLPQKLGKDWSAFASAFAAIIGQNAGAVDNAGMNQLAHELEVLFKQYGPLYQLLKAVDGALLGQSQELSGFRIKGIIQRYNRLAEEFKKLKPFTEREYESYIESPDFSPGPTSPSRPPGLETLTDEEPATTPAPPSAQPTIPTITPDEPIKRYTDVQFPERMRVCQTTFLVVNLTREQVANSRTAGKSEESAVTLTSLDDVEVCIAAPGFDILTDEVQTIRLYKERNSEPVRFKLKALTEGPQKLSLSFWQSNKQAQRLEISTLVTAVEAETSAGAATGATATAKMLEAVQSVPTPAQPYTPPDLSTAPAEVQILIEALPAANGTTQLNFFATYPDGTAVVPIRRIDTLELNGDPRSRLKALFDNMTKLARERKPAANQADIDKDIQKELKRIGQRIYKEYFPDKLKEIYRRFRISAKTILIISNEPWIPWEMAYPYDIENKDTPEEQAKYEGFLCDKFIVTRWLSGAPAGMMGQLPVSTACAVVPPSNLASAKIEWDFISSLPQTYAGMSVISPAFTRKNQVLDQLEEGGVSIVHFACHGLFDTTNPDQSSLQLEGTDKLSPGDIVGEAERTLRRTHPFFFLNACHSGVRDIELVGIGGWAERLIGSGCSGFLGALWEVNDTLATEFAKTFYTKLLDGATFGEACSEARQHIRKMNPANSTWLAYTLYADPLGKASIKKSE